MIQFNTQTFVNHMECDVFDASGALDNNIPNEVWILTFLEVEDETIFCAPEIDF